VWVIEPEGREKGRFPQWEVASTDRRKGNTKKNPKRKKDFSRKGRVWNPKRGMEGKKAFITMGEGGKFVNTGRKKWWQSFWGIRAQPFRTRHKGGGGGVKVPPFKGEEGGRFYV